MRRAVRIVTIVVKGVLIAVVGVLAFYNLYMLIARYAFRNEMPTFFGLAFSVVATGSMEPEISAGDVIITCAQDSYAVGDVVTYRDEARGGYITHRIVRIGNEGYITKGDANNAEDSAPVAADSVVGKVVSVWAGFGAAVQFLQSPLGLFAVLAGGIVLWLITDLLTGTFRKKDEQDQEDKDE